MSKSYKLICCLVIIFLSLSITNNSQAAARPFIELFEQIFKFFGKRADDVPLSDAGKKFEDFKSLGKTEDLAITKDSGKNFSGQVENLNLNKFNEIKNSSDASILEMHGVKNADKLAEVVDLSEIEISSFFEDKTAINTFRIILWSGRIFRASNSFNQPNTNRVIMDCRDNNDAFYFTALLEKKKKWLLLSENLKNETGKRKNNKINKQNLYVLDDKEEYIVFSTQTSENKKFPLHYFIISKNGKFYHFNNVYGTESPEYIIVNAKKRISETKFLCKIV